MDYVMLLTAFGGGALGAIFGGLIAFIFTGIAALVGIAIIATGGSSDILNLVAFGPVFGPHVAFSGGVFAAAYAGRIKKLDNGADIVTPLARLQHPGVLLAGGVAGALGYAINYLYSGVLAIPTDTIALTVLTIGVLARLIFGKSGLLGITPSGTERRFVPLGNDLMQVIVIGLAASLAVAAVVMKTEIAVLGFAISAASLLFAELGLPVPATHHITLVAAVAVLNSGNLMTGVLFGVIAAILCDTFGRIFNTHHDAHIDPPAFTIATLTAVVLMIY